MAEFEDALAQFWSTHHPDEWSIETEYVSQRQSFKAHIKRGTRTIVTAHSEIVGSQDEHLYHERKAIQRAFDLLPKTN
jgi:hypothetical protein